MVQRVGHERKLVFGLRDGIFGTYVGRQLTEELPDPTAMFLLSFTALTYPGSEQLSSKPLSTDSILGLLLVLLKKLRGEGMSAIVQHIS